MRQKQLTGTLLTLLLTGLLSLTACQSSCSEYRAAADRLSEHTTGSGDPAVEVLVPAGAERCFSDAGAMPVAAPSGAPEILAYLEARAPHYVLVGDDLAWDEVNSQPWFHERFRRLDQWGGSDPDSGSIALYTYVPSSFDLGRVTTVAQSFATDALNLRSFRLSSTHVEPNVPLFLSLFWDDVPGGDYREVMAQLDLVEKRSGRTWSAVQDTVEPASLSWHPEHRLTRRYLMVPPDDLPEGVYDLRLRLTERSGRPVSVGMGDAAEMLLVELTHPPDVSPSPIATEHDADYRFGGPEGPIGLSGYDAPPWMVQGDALRLALLWTAFETPSENLHVFVHLIDASGGVVAQSDGVPVYGFHPTVSWSSGDFIRDVHTLTLPGELPPGSYALAVGLYEPVSGVRLPVFDGQGIAMPMDQLLLHSLTIFPDL